MDSRHRRRQLYRTRTCSNQPNAERHFCRSGVFMGCSAIHNRQPWSVGSVSDRELNWRSIDPSNVTLTCSQTLPHCMGESNLANGAFNNLILTSLTNSIWNLACSCNFRICQARSPNFHSLRACVINAMQLLRRLVKSCCTSGTGADLVP